MSLFIHTIRGPLQSGKTTMALGILERLQRDGFEVVYIAPTQEWARHVIRIRKAQVPHIGWNLVWPNWMKRSSGCPWRAVVVDDIHLIPDFYEHIGKISAMLSFQHGPTQLILVRSE